MPASTEIRAEIRAESRAETRTVTEDEAGLRVDRWFRRHFPAVTHGQLQKLLRTGQIRVAGKRADAADRIEPGQAIRVPPAAHNPPPQLAATAKARDTSRLKNLILFQDDDVIALNKPAGLAVQGGTGLKENLDDMLDGLRLPGQSKPKLVHRLDRDTSGVLLVARNAFAAARLAESFRLRSTQKIYWGVTLGVPKPAKGKITAPLLKHGETMVVAATKAEREASKPATTIYQVMESAKKAAFIALWPVTGRTHQLRVHMQFMQTPLLGDRMYGSAGDPARRSGEDPAPLPFDEFGTGLHLHARRLIIPHPRRGVIDLSAPLGKEMQKTFQWFGFDAQAAADFSEA